jgi:hypothetical protein
MTARGATFGDLLSRNLPSLVTFSVMWFIAGVRVFNTRVMRSK